METRFTRAEYWLLETAVESWIPVCFVNPQRYSHPSSIEAMFNKPGHGLDPEPLLRTLDGLFQSGLIAAKRGGEECAPARQDLAAALSEAGRPSNNPSCLCYGLTEKGGAAWEAFAAPEWDRFIWEEFDDEEGTGEVISMVLWRLEKYLRYAGMLDCEFDLQTIRIEEIGPWEATYWKTLPSGHRARFRCRQHHDRMPEYDFCWLAFSGFCAFRDEWCRWR